MENVVEVQKVLTEQTLVPKPQVKQVEVIKEVSRPQPRVVQKPVKTVQTEVVEKIEQVPVEILIEKAREVPRTQTVE
eukprot:4762192-Amphidinium_carterae.1